MVNSLHHSLIMKILSGPYYHKFHSKFLQLPNWGRRNTTKTAKNNSLATFRSAHTCSVSSPLFPHALPSLSHVTCHHYQILVSDLHQHKSINIITSLLPNIPQTRLKPNIFRLPPQLNFYEAIVVGHTLLLIVVRR